MQSKPTQGQLDIIMYEVSQYLNKFKNVYTKTLYKNLRIKEKGLSLNKFRSMLYKMEDCGVITGVNGYKFVVTWSYGSDAECKTELYASDLIKC